MNKMKKTLYILLATLLTGTAAYAQEETPSHFKLYGFVRNYFTADTREVNAGTHELYFYMPKDVNMQDGVDINSGFNWRYLSLTTRLGLDISGYKFGSMNVSGKVEADFYSLSGTSLSAIVPQLRLRQAFIKLTFDESPLALTFGQTWHPMAADLPHMTNLESGAPFNPFSRTPQLTADLKAGAFTFTASLLYLNHFLPTGPDGKSVNYYKYGFPEAYLGVAFSPSKAFVLKAGVDMVNSKPVGYEGYNNAAPETTLRGYSMDKRMVKANGILTAISPFAFFQVTSGLFQLKGKTILAQSGEQWNLLSGYGVSAYDAASHTYTYTPMRDWASFLSFQYGKKFQVMAMAGYMKQLGTTADLMLNDAGAPAYLWMNTAGDTKIQQAFRVTPTLAWNIGKLTLSVEYNLTAAEFGRGTRNARGMYTGAPEWVMNHRFIFMTKFNL